jgi:chromatin remodeling complex protein RSC6
VKGSKIWGVEKHHLFVNGNPAWVYVSKEALEKDYNILKAKLPIPIGIDHLDPEMIQENKILEKMDLLNVGIITDVELKENGIHILEAQITNPLIQELYNDEKLPDFSMVGNVFLSECETGQVDYIENYNVINRVDFVEKGACTTCNVEYNDLMNAKSVIGDINMTEEGNENNPKNDDETTLTDVVQAISDFKEEQKTQFDSLDERIKALEENKAEANDPDPEENDSEGDTNEDNPEVKAMRAEIDEIKAQAAQKEATSIVTGYINEGKVLPKHVEKHVSLALAEPEAYKEMMAEAPEIVPIGERLSDAEAGNSDDEDSEEEDPVDELIERYKEE